MRNRLFLPAVTAGIVFFALPAIAQTLPPTPAPAAGPTTSPEPVGSPARTPAPQATAVAQAPAAHVAASLKVQSSSSAQAVAVEPAVIVPGQSVTLRWLFTGDKVVVSGGRFGQGLVVTGRTTIKDNPKQTTNYKFDVWYKVPSTEPDGKKTEKTVHAQYSALVQVSRPLKIALKLYRDPYGWQVSHLLGWKHDKENLPDPSNNALVFFQQEDDSVERLAVAILPVQEKAAEQLVEKVEKSLYDSYDDIKLGDKSELQHLGLPAVMTTFSGMDHTHPGTRTESVFLAFVKNGRGYVISARTKATLFAIRRPALERMVLSFALVEKTAQK